MTRTVYRGGDLHFPEVSHQEVSGEQAPGFGQETDAAPGQTGETYAVPLALFPWCHVCAGWLLLPQLCGRVNAGKS